MVNFKRFGYRRADELRPTAVRGSVTEDVLSSVTELLHAHTVMQGRGGALRPMVG